MTIAAPMPTDWCFDRVDITPLIQLKSRKKTEETSGDLTPHTLLEIIFGELAAEADRAIRDRLNEALRQWRLRRLSPT